ncbi:MAG: hypothetical protein ACE14S_06880 [Candidatus Bathyarchaeia archaeon]
MTAPRLSNTVKRTCDTLRQGASQQITDYEQRFGAMKNLYDDLLKNFIRPGYNPKEAWETAQAFFDAEAVRFAAVDGTMYSRPLFDMAIFFGGAYAATGTVAFSPDSAPKISYDQKTLGQGVGLSSVVPIYVNEIPDVDHSFASPEQPDQPSPGKPATDEEIANNSMIANSIMTFSEYYLALKLATDAAENPRVILMDRSLSTERAGLMYETRKTEFWHVKCAILGCEVDDEAVDQNDLIIARQHIANTELGLPPARADYLRTAIIVLLEDNKVRSESELISALAMMDEKRTRRLIDALKRLENKQILTSTDGKWSLNPKYAQSWQRIRKLTLELGEKLFFAKPTGTETGSNMKITKAGKEQWLTTLDISFLTLFAMQMLMEECWRKRILLVGITKDTAARDFKRQLIPLMHVEGMLKREVKLEALAELPNTDRMILQSASMLNADRVVPPWSLIEYDSAFRTMQPDAERGRGFVRGAIRNKISLERAFLKTYVQLGVAKSDPMLRSSVLLIDRLAYPEFDFSPHSTAHLQNALGDGTLEPVYALLFRSHAVPNRVQNMVMAMLVAMAPANLPEAFGHNKPLFVADKIAKWNYGQFKCVVDSTASWLLNSHKLRKFIFYMSTFRERRSQIEQTRREHS